MAYHAHAHAHSQPLYDEMAYASDSDSDDCCIDESYGSPASSILPQPRFSIPSTGSEGIRNVPLPGVRCPKCAKDGKEVWVIPGRACGYCGTACV
ncbi:hypothetical protein F503_08527 [Ophiostoma piceae UAMH 11346]|uniref:Uncharacterized protein n=1 Tax=Ophiostoma piceae (strain UAMH 11346) TaxID=1262450 RepID=S3BNJ4_OPHP1|nr:hypothetical protein F503_08527 [Ophiostoma piceae UAMH 11346]